MTGQGPLAVASGLVLIEALALPQRLPVGLGRARIACRSSREGPVAGKHDHRPPAPWGNRLPLLKPDEQISLLLATAQSESPTRGRRSTGRGRFRPPRTARAIPQVNWPSPERSPDALRGGVALSADTSAIEYLRLRIENPSSAYSAGNRPDELSIPCRANPEIPRNPVRIESGTR